MLTSAHQGYIYQDILGAYFVAQELANGRSSTLFHFDYKKTPNNIPDKFDDLTIYREESTIYIQVKYSNDESQHFLTKEDFSSSTPYDLALFDLFKTWEVLHGPSSFWRVCLAWDPPVHGDKILDVLKLSDFESLLPGTLCYQFDCDVLWPDGGEVLSSWKSLKNWSKSANREKFKEFLECLTIEVGCPKTTLLQNYSQGIEKLLARTIESIGIGVYPNDHLSVRQVAESLCVLTKRRRSTENQAPISCEKIANDVNIIQSFGGIEQHFPIDATRLVSTPSRISQIVNALEEYRKVVLTAEPGAGKSWFIENLENHIKDSADVVKHYCYTTLEDPLFSKRITVNALYGSLITQIIESNEYLSHFKQKRYASNLEELNLLLKKVKKKMILIIDGIDHIWRVYQKNRGGITEDETTILQALSQLDCSNPNILLLIVSQPIKQLEEISLHHITLLPISEEFVNDLLDRHSLPNIEIEGTSLSNVIYKKSNGNALYCKYLIEYASLNKVSTSFDWISNLPAYDFNLKGYYTYLYEQIQGDTRIPFALCGADFSLTESELREITHLGNFVPKQLGLLKPILKYTSALGYLIYHESFKRFVIDSLKDQEGSINYLVYRPLIDWLQKLSFFESSKAYGHLLKLYYEVDSYYEIAKTISMDFIENSLYHAQPLHSIRQNHILQKNSLEYFQEFSSMIIVAEQTKIIYNLEHTTDKVLINYLKAIQEIHGEEAMYRVLWDGEHLLVEAKDALSFLVEQAYKGKDIVHWSIVGNISGITYDMLGLLAIKLLHTKEYEKFDNLIENIYKAPKRKEAFNYVFNEIEWWNINFGEEWITNTPYFKNIFFARSNSELKLDLAVNRIMQNERFAHDDDWKTMLDDIIAATKNATIEERENVIKLLSQYNWFRNWLIYLINITELAQREEFSDDDIINAFTYLTRDLEPTKGIPRVCDLHKQLSFIKISFHKGLLLCNGNQELLIQCCEILERVTDVTMSVFMSFSGPLTDEEYLKLIANYLPLEYVISKYEGYYEALGSRRVYSDVAEIAFEYASILGEAGKKKEADLRYREGIRALTSYGYSSDRTFSEILDCSVPYQKAYGSLSVQWFYELYHMAMTVVTHTEGKGTARYPIEWFQEFIKLYPDEALKFLISETLESSKANWHQENEFYHVLEEHPLLFSPTQWFLLCRSLPFAASEKIICHGLKVISHIDEGLNDVFGRWLMQIPNAIRVDGFLYSQTTSVQFEKQFGILLESKEDKNLVNNDLQDDSPQVISVFPTKGIEEALAFLEINTLVEDHKSNLKQLIASVVDRNEKRVILRQIALSFKYGREVEKWLSTLFEPESPEWMYFNVCLFVFATDGWYHGLHYTNYLKLAYDVDPKETLKNLKEILGFFIAKGKYTNMVSCNLIKALSELKVEESLTSDLIQTTFQIVKRRLPNPPNSEINVSIYQSLEELTRDELVVALLIARLKTLTTEKTQGILWSLTYIAQVAPGTLYKPYIWAFSNSQSLLPIHRSILLQILVDYVNLENIPDELIGLFLSNYPTGFFLEDQYIRSCVGYNVELDENSARETLHKAHEYDKGFFVHIHPKYITLMNYIGSLKGSFRAYQYKIGNIPKDYESYYIKSEKILTPIVPYSNAAYEVINSQFYNAMKKIMYNQFADYAFNLEFFFPEIILQIGSLNNRPQSLPATEQFPVFETYTFAKELGHKEWIVLASREKEWYGKRFETKRCRYSSKVLTFKDNSAHKDKSYARYLFKINQYESKAIRNAPFDQPISRLDIEDTFEYSRILFISPWVVRELGLTVNQNIYDGLYAVNNQGELVVKMITWKEDYYGSVDNGTEVPRISGVAVLMKTDWYDRLIALYDEDLWFVLSQSEDEEDL